MNYKAIIFDLDGTIIETEHIWHHATTSLITSRGIAYTPELQQELTMRLHGLSMKESCQVIKDLTGIQDRVEDLVQEKMGVANKAYSEHIRFIDGFETFHQKVKGHNMAMAIATNAQAQTVAITDSKLNLTQFFGNHIYNISHVNFVGKPNPAIYLHAAQQLAIDPQDCIVIEDSAHGIEAAKRAGMFCVGINTSKKPGLLAQSDMIINHYNDLDLPLLLGHITNPL